jgi:tryptophan synthase alpha chain
VRTRIDNKLQVLRQRKEKAVAIFLTAGFPSREHCEEVLMAVEDGGGDLVEIGMPFSDPLADGPVIQHASAVALSQGIDLPYVLELVSRIRSRSSIPIVLMGYLNPILKFGDADFFESAAAAGVDGIILPEVPLEEQPGFAPLLDAAGLANILLVTPTSTADRIQRIDAASCGFLYCVSTTGVTGTAVTRPLGEYLTRVKLHASRNPLLVGFGIATPDDACRACKVADGVIVGSAFMRFLNERRNASEIKAWIGSFKTALQQAG